MRTLILCALLALPSCAGLRETLEKAPAAVEKIGEMADKGAKLLDAATVTLASVSESIKQFSTIAATVMARLNELPAKVEEWKVVADADKSGDTDIGEWFKWLGSGGGLLAILGFLGLRNQNKDQQGQLNELYDKTHKPIAPQ